MATEKRKGSSQQVPDPASSYGREKPEHESGMGRLDNNKATPSNRPDRMDEAVRNRQKPRQINADDGRQDVALPPPGDPDHSMKEEEPMGADQAPTDIHNPRDQRQPRTKGKGGTPTP
jgi:hypothetical protein